MPDVEAEPEWTDDWAYLWDYWSSTGGTANYNVEGSSTTTVGSEEPVTVPAGSFTARRFDSRTTIDGMASTSSWYAKRQLGLVRSDAVELVTWSE